MGGLRGHETFLRKAWRAEASIRTHQAATFLASPDRILVIRGGKIQESGTHEELLALGGYYHDLYEHQFREERLKTAMKDAGME